MELQLNEIKSAMNLVNQQITKRLLQKGSGKVRLALSELSEIWLIYQGGQISVVGPLKSKINPTYPDWIHFESDSEKFVISADATPYTPEIAFFLIEIWKAIKLNPEISLEEHITESLMLIERRWKLNGEPISRKEQRGLIGEIEAVIHTEKIKGINAIEAWDHTSHQLQDLLGMDWAVEAKSKGKDSKNVSISSLNQLKWQQGIKLALSVTNVSSNAKGSTFPEYVDFVINKLTMKDRMCADSLLLKLQTIGYNEATRNRFRSRWIIPEEDDTTFYKIGEDSPTNWWAEEKSPKMPKCIEVSRYSLDISDDYFKPQSLEDII